MHAALATITIANSATIALRRATMKLISPSTCTRFEISRESAASTDARKSACATAKLDDVHASRRQ